MVEIKMGDLFESSAQTLVNTVNCVGIMGKGVALEFKKRFPGMFKDYVERCEKGQVQLGKPYLYRSLLPPWVLNFPTKGHWRSVSQLTDIEDGLRFLQSHYREWNITSLAVPPLGCGQGQLEWRVVGPTLYRYLGHLDIPVELYAPFGTPHAELDSSFLKREVSSLSPEQKIPYHVEPSWIAIMEILACIEREPYHWPVGRTTFQKIAYFATESGLPTGLHYQRGSYGPYSPDLKRRIAALIHNGLLREEQLGRMFTVRTGSTYPDANRTYEKQLLEWRPLIDRISDLFMRMNTQQAEIAASVHFAAKELSQQLQAKPSEREIFTEVMEWKQRRNPPLAEEDVALAVRNLGALGWIDAKASADLPLVMEEVLCC